MNEAKLRLRVARIEAVRGISTSVLDLSRDVAVAALRNPAVTMIGGVALSEYCYRKKYITSVDAGAINAVLISSGLISSLGTDVTRLIGALR